MKKTLFISVFAAILSSFLLQAQPMPIPEVTIAATVANTSEAGPTPGLFTVTRGRGTNSTVSFAYALRVFYQIGGTALNGVDYRTLSNYVVIPSGMASAMIHIAPLQDTLAEGDETVSLTLRPSSMSTYPYYVGAQSNAVVTIADDDPRTTNLPPTVQIVSPTNGSTFTAPANIMIFAHPQDVDGQVQTVEFFAGNRSLGIVTNDPLRMPPMNPWHLYWSNVLAGTYALTAVATDDRGATGISARVFIAVLNGTNRQPVVSIVATDPEGSEIPVVPPGTTIPQRFDPAIFTVTRTGGTDLPLTVFYNIGGTAQNGVDYARLSNSVTIPIGAASADVIVAPIDDALVEGTETVVLRIQPPICPAVYPPPYDCYLVGSPGQAAAHILDDDTNQPPVTPPVVTVVATDPNAAEIPVVPPWLDIPQLYDPGVFTVSRTGEITNPLTVFYYLRGTAQNGIDYARLSNYVVIPAGAASADIVVDPIDDALVEGAETVALHLRPAMLPRGEDPTLSTTAGAIIWPAPYVIGSPSNAVVTIADDDIVGTNIPPRVQIVRPLNNSYFRAPANILLVAGASDLDGSVSSVEFFEGANSLGMGAPMSVSTDPGVHFGLTWSNVAAGRYVLTAKATDNQGAWTISAPISISVLATNPPPVTNTMPVVNITALDSIASEGTNDFPTTVIMQSNRLCSSAWGLSNWVRLDPATLVYWTNVFCGTNTATFEVRRSGTTNSDLTVFYSIQGTASNGVDYVALSGAVTIPAGHRAARIIIVPIEDDLAEGRETVILALTLPPASSPVILPSYVIGTHGRAGAVILDNDAVLPPSTRLPGGAFYVFLPATDGSGYRLETSSDLAGWASRLTDIVNGTGVHYVDPDAGEAAFRFYRIMPEPVIVPED